MTPQVSILVPIYNVSAYIERCARSLFEQTFEDIEYIFIDDCSPDNSIEILQKIIEQYPHRKAQAKIIYHSANKGIATARNSLLNNATGKYILFVDSDDFVEKNMVELLYNKIVSENADIAVCDFFVENENEKNILTDTIFSDSEQNNLNIIEARKSFSGLWNKLIIRDLYNLCSRPPEGMNYSEDRYLMMQLYFLANKIVKVDKPLYHYMVNANSISNNVSEKHFENTILRWNLIENFYQEHGIYNKYKDIIGLSKVNSKGALIINASQKELRKKYAKMFSEDEEIYLQQSTLDKKIILFLIRKKMFFGADIFCRILLFYNRKIKK
jgi:glycosyltransferase involved in cell wall biosynthesis